MSEEKKARDAEDFRIFKAMIKNKEQGNKLFIIAGSYDQAIYYARHAMLSKQDWRYVRDPYSFDGFYKPKYVKVGTYYKNHRTREMEDYLIARRAEDIMC